MTDLRKNLQETELIQSELRTLATTNHKLQGELETARQKLNNELDVLTYRLDKVAYETEEIRREVRDINRTIEKLRYDLLDAIRNNRKSELSDILSKLFPIFVITAPVFLVTILLIVIAATS